MRPERHFGDRAWATANRVITTGLNGAVIAVEAGCLGSFAGAEASNRAGHW